MKQNKGLTVVLAVLVLAIWGTIIYRIVDAVSEGDSEEVIIPQSGTSSSEKAGERFVYKDDVRDPFQFRSESSRKPVAAKDTTVTPIWTEPPFKLVGIMQKERLATAVLQRDDGATFFVRKGDTLGGLKILNIDQKRVEYLYRAQKRSWNIAPVAQ